MIIRRSADPLSVTMHSKHGSKAYVSNEIRERESQSASLCQHYVNKSAQVCTETGLAIGDRVYLRGARFGASGKVMRMERGKAVVSWSDLNLITRHRPETLSLAGEVKRGETR